MCGPAEDEGALDTEGLMQRMQEAAALINYLVSRWGEHPVKPGQRCADADGRVYRVVDAPQVVSAAKESLSVQAGVFYRTEDCELYVLLPGSPQPQPTRH